MPAAMTSARNHSAAPGVKLARMHSIRRSLVIVASAALVTGCASDTETGTSAVAPAAGAPDAFDCPVTLPPAEPFIPPKPWPQKPAGGSYAWFGTDALWTVLDVKGKYSQRKSVWWSAKFPGGGAESRPPIAVTWRRLDTDERPITEPGPGTNAFTPEEQWWMIAGFDPEIPGCWEVTGTYKGATLRYVYRRNQ